MRKFLLTSLMFLLPTVSGLTPNKVVYTDKTASVPDRVSDLLSRLTLDEKITLVGGTGFATAPIARLNIPPLNMTDGAVGVRWDASTSFPSAILMAASFDRDLYRQVSAAIGDELRAEGRDMLLGPTVGIARVPFGGRNFESLGEDPFLTAEMMSSYIHGLHDKNAAAVVKHFALNDQEHDRMTVNSIADERTLHEIHLVAFERAVAEGVDAVMASYNLIDGLHASENSMLLTNILKKQWGFKGIAMSDWGATHSTVPAALAGLDLEMPTPDFFGAPLMAAVQNGQVPKSLIDDKVSRILTVLFERGLFDGAATNRPAASEVNSPAHQKLALQMASEGHVLLKNRSHTLPLDLGKVHTIAVIGPNGPVMQTGGGGSSFVTPVYSISPYQGLLDRLAGTKTSVNYAWGVQMPGGNLQVDAAQLVPAQGEGSGLYGEYFNNINLEGPPVLTRIDAGVNLSYDDQTPPGPGLGAQNYSVRWTGQLIAPVTGDIQLATISDDGVRLWIDGKLVIDNWTNHNPTTNNIDMQMTAGQSYDIRLEYFQAGGSAQIELAWTLPAAELKQQALALAKSSDAVVLALGFYWGLEGEAQDRATFGLPRDQEQLIEAVVQQNPNTILVVNTGNPISMEGWLDKIPAMIYAWYPGEEGGHALADILLGNVNPSGRLPVTMLKHWTDSPAYGSYPGKGGEVVYKEGIYVGYRYYDKAGVAPNFPFGYGLSYTTFGYTNLKVTTANATAGAPDITVTATITNTGNVAGAEVAQLYVHDQAPKIDRPVQELKGFERVVLQPGESKQVTFKLDHSSFAFYDVVSHGWKALPGQFTVRVGASSRDIRLVGDVKLE